MSLCTTSAHCYGLPVSTSSAVAPERYQVFEETMVMRRLRLGRPGDALRLARRHLDRQASTGDLVWLDQALATVGPDPAASASPTD